MKSFLQYEMKKVWHRQGKIVESISDEFAEYALNLAATNIVLLVGIYKSEKEQEIVLRV